MEPRGERSTVPKETRQNCVERNLGTLKQIGETNRDRNPMYKCTYCRRYTLNIDSQCYPLEGDIKPKKSKKTGPQSNISGDPTGGSYEAKAFTLSSESEY